METTKFTPYGSCVSIGSLVFLSIVKKMDVKLILIFIASIIIQSFLCKTCQKEYTLASQLSVFPLMLLLIGNCTRLHEIIIAISISLAIGRIGCYFAGCCTGFETSQGITYKEHYTVNKKLKKKNVTVFPSIFIEILSQFIIAFIVSKSEYGLVWFGILNAILVQCTHKWRLSKRMGINKNIPIISLLVFSLLAYIKCGKLGAFNLTYKIQGWMILFSLILGFIVSNDINLIHIKKLIYGEPRE